MEHLTKAQIVLLTLFVSFVASMATGVVVVTLMEQAPGPVNQTITNVVERTIEKITPTFIEKPGKTVIVKDEDLVVAAIENNSKSVLALRTTTEAGDVLANGVGTIVSKDGLVVTDSANFNQGLLTTTINGVQYRVEFIARNSESGLGIGKLAPVSATSTPPFDAVSLGDVSLLKLGQTALVIGGRDGKTISTGLITNLDMRTITDKETKEETKILSNIGISTKFSSTSNGAPIINLDGSVVGFLSINEVAGTQSGIPGIEARSLIEEANTPPVEKKI